MRLTIKHHPTCWEDTCMNPITAKRGVLCSFHRKVARQEIAEEAHRRQEEKTNG